MFSNDLFQFCDSVIWKAFRPCLIRCGYCFVFHLVLEELIKVPARKLSWYYCFHFRQMKYIEFLEHRSIWYGVCECLFSVCSIKKRNISKSVYYKKYV